MSLAEDAGGEGLRGHAISSWFEARGRGVQDIVVLSEVPGDELLGYLDDLYDKWALPMHPSVRRT